MSERSLKDDGLYLHFPTKILEEKLNSKRMFWYEPGNELFGLIISC